MFSEIRGASAAPTFRITALLRRAPIRFYCLGVLLIVSRAITAHAARGATVAQRGLAHTERFRWHQLPAVNIIMGPAVNMSENTYMFSPVTTRPLSQVNKLLCYVFVKYN